MASNFLFELVTSFYVNWNFSITSPNDCSFSSILYYVGLVRTHLESKGGGGHFKDVFLLCNIVVFIQVCWTFATKLLPSKILYIYLVSK